MTLVADFIDRLNSIDPPVFAIVEGAAEFSLIEKQPPSCPAVYVLVEQEVSAPSERMTGPVLQRCEADIAVVIVTDNVSDITGGAAASDIETLKRIVRAALVGFVPASADDGSPVEHVEGGLLKARDGLVWQRELFTSSFYISEP